MPASSPPAPTVVVTGASDGIGAMAAHMLAASGAHVVVVGRSVSKTRAVAEALGAPWHVADFAEFESVRTLAQELLRYPRIDVLANNAGMVVDHKEVRAGVELSMKINHLSPFLLTQLLLPSLLDSHGSVINTSSIANWIFARPKSSHLLEPGHFSPMKAYGNSKLANILFTHELHRRFAPTLRSAAFHPGVIRSNFAQGAKAWVWLVYQTPLRNVMLSSVEEGAFPLVRLATTTEWESGAYYVNDRKGHTHHFARNPDHAAKLWEESMQAVGLTS